MSSYGPGRVRIATSSTQPKPRQPSHSPPPTTSMSSSLAGLVVQPFTAPPLSKLTATATTTASSRQIGPAKSRAATNISISATSSSSISARTRPTASSSATYGHSTTTGSTSLNSSTIRSRGGGGGSASTNSAASSASSRPAPSAALMAAALQNQFMSSISLKSSGTTAQGALSQAKKKAAAALAQQLGLIPQPPPKLTHDQWDAVRNKARERGEHQEPCPICQEAFKDQEQVLLSCSHVFHKTCLRNFEKFSGTKVCPICRSKEYEKKLIDDAAVEYKEQCATKIQACYRGHVVRKQYLLMLETIPPKDAAKRKDFFMKKLTHTSTKLAQLMENRDTAIDALFADIDKSVMQVRDSLSAAAVQLKVFTPDEWSSIRKRASLRDENECPICCSGFDEPPSSSSSAASSTTTPSATPSHDSLTKRRILLSCSHSFHHGCLLSFERFTIASSALDGVDHSLLQRQQTHLEALTNDATSSTGEVALLQPPPTCLCPICRSNYQKVWF